MKSLFAFMPDSMIILAVVAVAFALIFGLNRAAAIGLIGFLLVFAFLSPFMDSFFSGFPLWLLLLLAAFFILGLLRAALNGIFGRGATDQFVGQLMFSAFTLPFRIIGSFFRGGR